MAEIVNTCFVLWLAMLLIWGAVKVPPIRKRLHQPFFIVFFGLVLATFRLIGFIQAWRIRHQQRIDKLPTRAKAVVETTLDLLTAYQLKPTEVIMGMAPGKRPVKMNIMDQHTLLGGLTGGGKSWLLHAMLIQLFGKGRIFTDLVKVYILDMKGHPEDMWWMWKPLCSGFAQRGKDGSIYDALELLRNIDQMLQEHVDQKILLIVEEAPILTENNEGDQLLARIAAQLRLNGAVIATIQHPHSQSLKTVTKHNMPRRICGMVINVAMAELILEIRPDKKLLPKERGQYLTHEAGKPNITAFTAIKPDLPNEIDIVVNNTLSREAESDPRLKILWDVASNKKKGSAMPGARTLAANYDWLPNAQLRVQVAYRNYAIAGAFIPPTKRGESSYLAVEFPDAFAKVKRYIEAGRWKEEPPSREKNEDLLSSDETVHEPGVAPNRRGRKSNGSKTA